jgi:O-antigen/teichoic acid export membrane protein
MKRDIIRNVTSNWAGLFINMAIAFLLSPFLVHRLGNINYGLWVLIQSLTGYMGLLEAGLRVSVVKYVSRLHAIADTEGLNRIVSTSLAMYGLIALLVLVVTAGMELFFDRIFPVPQDALMSARVVLLLAAANLALTLVFSVFSGFLAGLQRYDITNKIGIPVTILRSLAIFYFVSQGFGIISLGLIHLLSQAVSGGLFVRECYKKYRLLQLSRTYLSLESVRSLYGYSIFILMNSLSMMLLFKSGEILTGVIISTAAVTYYAIAGGLTQYLSDIIGTMTQVLHPFASAKEARGDFAGIRSAVLGGTKICLLITLPVTITLILFGKPFITSWMGESYAAVAAPLLTILAISRAFWLAQSATGNILLGIGKHKILTTINLATGVGSIIGGLTLIRHYGLLGLVIGSAIPVLFTQGLIMPLYTCYAFRISITDYIRESWLGPVLATLCYAVILTTVRQTDLPNTIPGLVASVLIALPSLLIVAYFVCFSKIERQIYIGVLRSLLPSNSKEGSGEANENR